MLTKREAIQLGEAINSLVTDRGLGAISKKDYELLVFHHLSTAAGLAGKGNYTMANHFKITETKVKSLRLESSLRHQPADHELVLKRIAERVLDQAKSLDAGTGKVVITLEDPVERRELEHAVKQAKHIVGYQLNRENLEITLSALFEVLVLNVKNVDEALKSIIRKEVEDDQIRKELLSQTHTTGERTRKACDYFIEKGWLVAAVQAAISALGS